MTPIADHVLGTTRTVTATPVTADAAPTVTGQLAPLRLRNAFTITSGRRADGCEHHLVTAPKHGPDRAQARRAILAVLRHADRHHHRVSFQVTLGDYTQQALNTRHGYDANQVLLQCRIEHGDPYAWLQRQFPRTASTTDTNAIIGVHISTWPDIEP
jgi:hypothetical protein